MTIAALVLAAGRGERLGHKVPKAYVALAGQSLLERSLATLESSSVIDWVQPVIGQGDLGRYNDLNLAPSAKRLAPVVGGAERQDSVAAGVAALPADVEWVAVHDAARCMVSTHDVTRVVEAAKVHTAALLAAPARDTIKRVRDGCVVETPDRAECWAAQTPQVFRRDLLTEAHEKAKAEGFVGTDDSQLVERLGVKVAVVRGDARNVKITLPEDLLAAEGWLSSEENK
jgi:2-C-methyl-D-erythritol 4-phosphate cytidylyltransferase